MNRSRRFLEFLWDPTGRRRREQVKREASTQFKITQLQSSQARAADQVRRTQEFVYTHRRSWR